MANFFSKLQETLFGKPEQMQQQSFLTPQQQQLALQQQQAAMGQGAGGAFGQSADFFRSLMDPSSQAAQAQEAPLMRQFQEDIMPDLAEQFAGMGSGGLSSSGFRNSATRAGTDLAERLGSLRSQLSLQGAQGLSGIGQQSLTQQQENIFRPETQGLLGGAISGLAGGVGQGLGLAAKSKLPILGGGI